MKKRNLIPLTAAAVAALLTGVNNVDAKTFTAAELIKEYSKDGSYYNEIYVAGSYIFQDTLSLKEIYMGAAAGGSVDNAILYHLDSDGKTWTDVLSNNKKVTPPARFDLDKARLNTGKWQDLTDDELAKELAALESEMKALKAEQYTTASFKPVTTALARDNNGTTKSMREKVAALTAAKSGLVFANIAELNEVKNEANTILASDYTEVSYKAFTDAYTNAKKMEENSYDKINNKIQAILDAMDKLAVDKGALNTAAKEILQKTVDGIPTTLVEADYTKDSFEKYQTAKDLADALLAASDVTTTEYKNANEELKKAYEGLVKADKAEFEKVLKAAKALNSADYIRTTADVLEAAIVKAEEVASKADPANDEYQTSISALNDAMEKLIKKTTEKALSDALLAANKKTGDFSTETQSAFDTAKGDVEAVVDAVEKDGTTIGYTIKSTNTKTDAELTELAKALTEATKNLEFEKLQDMKALIDKAKKLVSSDYTAETWAKFLEEKNRVIDKDNKGYATNDEVVQYYNYLDSAMIQLEAKDSNETDVNELKALVNETLTEKDYSVESWATYKKALAAGKELFNGDDLANDATISKVKAALNALKDAKAKLEFNKEVLVYAIQLALETKTSENYKYYTNKAAFEAVLADAQRVRDNVNNKEEIDKAIKNLTEFKLTVDKTSLKSLLDIEAPGMKDLVDQENGKEVYETTSWTNYINAVNAAIDVYENADAQSEDILGTIKDVTDNKALLIHVEVVEAYNTIKATADAIKTDVANYENTADLIDVLDKLVTPTTEAEYKDATAKLTDALDKVVAGNKADLDEVVEEARKALAEESKYTKDSINALRSALNDNPEATYDEIDGKITAVNTALNNLVFANKATLDDLITKVNAEKTADADNNYDWSEVDKLITKIGPTDDLSYDAIASYITELNKVLADTKKEFKSMADLKDLMAINISDFVAGDETKAFTEALSEIKKHKYESNAEVEDDITTLTGKAEALVNKVVAEYTALTARYATELASYTSANAATVATAIAADDYAMTAEQVELIRTEIKDIQKYLAENYVGF